PPLSSRWYVTTRSVSTATRRVKVASAGPPRMFFRVFANVAARGGRSRLRPLRGRPAIDKPRAGAQTCGNRALVARARTVAAVAPRPEDFRSHPGVVGAVSGAGPDLARRIAAWAPFVAERLAELGVKIDAGPQSVRFALEAPPARGLGSLALSLSRDGVDVWL